VEMHITFEQFCDILSKRISEQRIRDEYIYNIPSEISSAIFDNVYSNSLYSETESYLKLILGSIYEDFNWFLYDWDAEDNNTFWISDAAVVINDSNDFIEYIKRKFFTANSLNTGN
jgi:hypothetical protein